MHGTCNGILILQKNQNQNCLTSEIKVIIKGNRNKLKGLEEWSQINN